MDIPFSEISLAYLQHRIDKKLSLDAVNYAGRSWLMMLVARNKPGDFDMIQLMLANGANPRRIDNGGHTALSLAVANSDMETVKIVATLLLDPSVPGFAPLPIRPITIAAEKADLNLFTFLADMRGVDAGGRSVPAFDLSNIMDVVSRFSRHTRAKALSTIEAYHLNKDAAAQIAACPPASTPSPKRRM